MTASGAPRVLPLAGRASPRPHRAPLADALRSEWTKLRSLRSTFWTLLATVVATVGIGALICFADVHSAHHAPRSVDPTALSLSGVALAQLAIGVLGVLTISAEHTTGSIRTTLTSWPERGKLVVAKGIVFGAAVLVVGLVSAFAAFFAGQAVLASGAGSVSITAPGVLRAVIGASLYLVVVGMLALGLGTIIRRTAGGIAALFGLLLVLPLLVLPLPSPWSGDVGKYLPGSAGSQVYTVAHASGSLAPWVGFGVFCGYALASLGIGIVLIRRRDV